MNLERLLVWAGGGVFVTALAYTAWWYAAILAQVTPFTGWESIAIDTVLFTIFACHHSLLARGTVKQAVERLVPQRLLRSVYVWTASILLIAVCLLWQPIGGDLYHIEVWSEAINITVQLVGVLLIALSVRAIDALELAGIRDSSRAADLQVRGPYRLVRHPLYLGWMLILFGAAHMTGDRLTFAIISSAYLVLAIPWEERSLEAAFPASYGHYKRMVPWKVVPFLY